MAITDEEIGNFLSSGIPKPTSGDEVIKDLSRAQLADYFAGKPLPKSGPGFISDIGSKLVSGTGTGISSLGWLAGSKDMEDYGTQMAQGAEMAMSPAGIERSQREIFPAAAPGQGIMGLGFNPAGLAKVPYAIAESAPAMLAGVGAALGATAILPETAIVGVGSLAMRALGPLAGRVAASSLGEAGVAAATNSGIGLLDAAAPLLGKRLVQTMAASGVEGTQSGAMTGQQVEQDAIAHLTKNPGDLEKSELGRASLQEANGDVQAAIKLTAARMGMEAFYKTAPSTALLALPGGYLESRLTAGVANKGLLKETGIGAFGEAAQEGPQSAAEEYLRGSVMSQADPSQAPTLPGVVSAGLEGAIIGAGMGSGMGAVGYGISPAQRTAADVETEAQQELFAKLQTFVAGRNLYEPAFSEAPIIETKGGDQISIPTLLAYADTITDTSDPIYAINKQTADPGERAALLAEIMHPRQIYEAKKMGEQAKVAEEAAARQAETDRANAEWEQTQQRLRQIDEENATRQAAGQEELLAGAAATRPTSAPEGSTEELVNTARDFRQNLGQTSYQDDLTPYSDIANSLIEEQPAGEMLSTQVLQRRVEELSLSPIDIKTTQEVLDRYSTDVEDPNISVADKPLYKDPEGYYYKRGEIPGTPGPEYARRRRRRRAAAAEPAADMSDVMPEIAAEPTPPAVSEEEYNNVRLSLNDEIARIAAAGRGGERAADAVRRALRNKNFNAPQLLAAINIAKDQARILGNISSARPVTQFLENLTDDSGAGAQGVRYGRTKNSVAGLIQYSLAPDQISFSNQTGVHEALHVVQSLLKAYDPNTYRIVANDFSGENGRGITVSQIPKDIQRKLKLLTPEKGGKISYWDMLNAEFGANAPPGNQTAFAEHPDESMAYTFAMLDDARRRGYKMGGLKPAYLRFLNLFSQIQQSVRKMLGGARSSDEILSRISGGTFEAPGVPGRRLGAEQPRSSSRRNAEFSSRQGSIEPSPEGSSEERKAWESKGVVRGKDDKPLQVYTGTTSDNIFDAFDVRGSGVWFTTDKDVANDHADTWISRRNGNSWNAEVDGETRKINNTPRVIPAYIRMQKPLVLTDDQWSDVVYEYDSSFGEAVKVPKIKKALDDWNERTGENWHDWDMGGPIRRAGQTYVFDRFRAQGYDGIQVPEIGLYVVLGEPSQIKSPFNTFPEGAAEDKKFSKRYSSKATNKDAVYHYIDNMPFGTTFNYKDFWNTTSSKFIKKPEFKDLMEEYVKNGAVSIKAPGLYTLNWPTTPATQFSTSNPVGGAAASKKPSTPKYIAKDLIDVISKTHMDGDTIDANDLAKKMNTSEPVIERLLSQIYSTGGLPLIVSNLGSGNTYTTSTLVDSDFEVMEKLVTSKGIGKTIDFNDFFWKSAGSPSGENFDALVEVFVNEGYLAPLNTGGYEVVGTPPPPPAINPAFTKGLGTLLSALPDAFNNYDFVDMPTVMKITGLTNDEAKAALDALYAEGYPMLAGTTKGYYFTDDPAKADVSVMTEMIESLKPTDEISYADFMIKAEHLPTKEQFHALADAFVKDLQIKKNPDGTYSPNIPNVLPTSLYADNVETAVESAFNDKESIKIPKLAALVGLTEDEALKAIEALYGTGYPHLVNANGVYKYYVDSSKSDFEVMSGIIKSMQPNDSMGYATFEGKSTGAPEYDAYHALANYFVIKGILTKNKSTGKYNLAAKAAAPAKAAPAKAATAPSTIVAVTPSTAKSSNEPTDQQIEDVKKYIAYNTWYNSPVNKADLYQDMKLYGHSTAETQKALDKLYTDSSSGLASSGGDYFSVNQSESDAQTFLDLYIDVNLPFISYSDFVKFAVKAPTYNNFHKIAENYVKNGVLTEVVTNTGTYYDKGFSTGTAAKKTAASSAASQTQYPHYLNFLQVGDIAELTNDQQVKYYAQIEDKVNNEPDDMSMTMADLYHGWFKGINDTSDLDKALSHAFHNDLLYNKKNNQIVKGKYPQSPSIDIQTPYEPLPQQKPLTDAEIAELQKIAPNISKVGFRWLEEGLRDIREFAEWFSDSDKVDSEGKPIPWYRGTRSNNSPLMNSKDYGGENGFFASAKPKFASNWAGSGKNSRMQPVFLKAANTFDYENQAHLNLLKNHPDFTGSITSIGNGYWPEIEVWPFLYRRMGFDSYYMLENGAKNIAVFERQQMKSIFNQFKPGAGKEEAYSKRKALQLPAGMSEKDYVYGRMADITTDPFLRFFKESIVSEKYPRTIIRSSNGERKQISVPAPKVVYHSGYYDETTGAIPMKGRGKFSKGGMHFGTRQSAEERTMGKRIDDAAQNVKAYKGDDKQWHWIDDNDGTTSEDLGYAGSASKDAAIKSGQMHVVQYMTEQMNSGMDFDAPPLTAVYLSIQNPKVVKDQGWDWDDAIKQAKAEGHDGIVYKNLFEDIGSESYIVFYPEQIKSIYNVGSFDPTVQDIRFSKRGALKPKGLRDEDYVYGRMADITTKSFEKFFEGSEVTSGDLMSVTRMINGKRVKVEMPAPLVVYHNGTYDEQRGMIPMKGKGPYRKTGMHFGTKQSAEDRVPIEYGNKKHKEEVGMKLASVFADQYQLPNGDFAWENNADVLTEQDGLTPKQREGFRGFKTEEEAVEAGKKYVERYYAAGNYVQTAVYLSIKNPKRVQDQGLDWEKEIKKAKAEGYDGIFYYNLYEDYGSISWIAFSPNQIKSVYNTGAFDPNVEDIRHSSRQSAVAALEAAYVPGRIADTNTEPFKRWFKKSVVRNGDIAVMGIDPKTGLRAKTYRINPAPMFHAGSFRRSKSIPMDGMTDEDFPTDHMHWGTKRSALDRASAMSESDVERSGKEITAAYLSIQNPKLVNDIGGDPKKWSALVEQAKAEGYDGLVYINKYEDIGSKSYVIFNANQAKATDNVGTFSPMLNDMRFSSRQADANAASRAIMNTWEAEKKAARAAGKEPPKRPWGNQQYGTGVWADPPNLGPRPRGRNMPGTPWGGRSGMSGKFSARQGSIEPLQEWSPQGAQLARRTAELANEISQEQGAGFYQKIKNTASKIFHPLGAMTKRDEKLDYLTERYLALGKIDLSEKDATKTYEALRNLPKNEADLVFKYLTTKNAVAPTLSLPGAREAAIRAKTTISEYGDRLVAARILSPQAVAEYKGSYLPRMYMKYLLEEKGMISSGIKMDLAYANKRENLSAEERLALGEVKDPGFLAFMALYRPSRDLAVMGFLKNILSISRDKGYDWFLEDNLVEWRGATVTSHWLASEADAINERADYFVSDPAKQKAMNDLATEMRKLAAPGMKARVPQDYKVIPDTNRYGALRGMIARKEVYDDIVGTGGVINADNWWDRTFGDTGSTLSKATAFWKMTKTTMNPPTQVRNFVTNAVVMDLSGVNTFKIPYLLGKAAKEISTGGEYFKIAQKYGISASGFSQIELREANQIMQDMLSRSEGGALNIPHMLKTVGAWTVQKAGDVYAFSEILFKTAKLIDNLEKGMKENEAALDAHDWFFDYSLVHPSIRRIRSVPFGMPFITYYYKILPKLVETLINHPMRFAKYAALAFAIPAVFAAQNDVEEEDFENLRNSLSERIRKKQNLWAIPDKDENGNWNFLDVGYMLPWSMFQDIITSLSGGDVGAATQSFGLLGSPALSVAAAIKTNIDPFTGKKIWDDSDTPNERAKSLMNYIISVIAPPFVTGTGFLGKLIDKAQGTGLNKYGEPVDTNTQLAGRLLGFNIYSLNPQMQRMRNVSSMERDIREIEIRRTYTLRDQSLTPERRRERAAELNDYIREKRAELQKYIKNTQIPEALKAGKE